MERDPKNVLHKSRQLTPRLLPKIEAEYSRVIDVNYFRSGRKYGRLTKVDVDSGP